MAPGAVKTVRRDPEQQLTRLDNYVAPGSKSSDGLVFFS